MRLLYISHSFPPPDRPLTNLGGMQRVATDLYAALRKKPGLDLSAFLLESSWVMHHVRGPGYLLRGHRRLRRLAREGGVDAILFSSIVTPALMMPPWEQLRAQGIVTAAIVHGRDVTEPVRPYQALVRRALANLDAVLPVSRASRAVCEARGLAPERAHVVPNGINLRRFRPLAAPSAMRAELCRMLGEAFPDSALLLCSVGRQVPRKGFAWFIDQVMPLLPEDVHYLLAGDGPEGENIRAAVERRGLQHRVRFLGRVSERELETLYRGADLFIMPNRPVPNDLEGFGVVMLEAALGGGLPAIAAGLEGIRDVITEGVNGHLVPTGDAWAFSEAIMQYYHDRPALDAASARAAAHVRKHFCWSAIADRHLGVLRELTTPAPVELALPL